MSARPFDPTQDLVVVLMAGGAGTRFWPASTEARPKQFLPFFGDRSLFQQAYDRVVDLVGPQKILVLTQERFRDLVRAQLPSLPPDHIIGEPMRRDTAAAVALAALLAEARFGNPVMAVLSSDHLIEPTDAFQKTLCSAARGAADGEALYTFGIEPSFPATGYGYLHRGARLMDDDGVQHAALQGFVEKPDLDTATRYLQAGEYLWNSGMFVWRTDAILREYERQLPAHLAALRPAIAQLGTPDFADALAAGFLPLEKKSVDFGIMEGARCVRCVSSAFSWSDVGGFLALAGHLDTDAAQNAARGHVAAYESENNIVFCEDPEEEVALLGVSDLIVVRSGKRTLVVPQDRAEDIKKLVATLPARQR